MLFDLATSATKPHDIDCTYQLIADLWINGAELTAQLTALEEKLNTNPTRATSI